MATDPVCKMTINEKDAAGTSVYNGTTYYFCSMPCKKDFDKDPEAYLKVQSESPLVPPLTKGGKGGFYIEFEE